jgi:hypothetical protein
MDTCRSGVVALLFILFVMLSAGCGRKGDQIVTPPVRPASEVWVNDIRTLEDGTTLARRADGTIFRESGWQLPLPMPEKKKWHATTVAIDGNLVEVLNTPFFPEQKLMMRFPRHADDGDDEYKVTQILEFTNKAKKPYCYQFFGEEDREVYSGVTTYFSYRDDDGDGVFETLAGSCSVPAWVK